MTSGCIYNIAGSHVLNRMLSSIATSVTSLIVRPKYLDQTNLDWAVCSLDLSLGSPSRGVDYIQSNFTSATEVLDR